MVALCYAITLHSLHSLLPLVCTVWHRVSLKLKENFGTSGGFEICPHQFCHFPLVPHCSVRGLPSVWAHQGGCLTVAPAVRHPQRGPSTSLRMPCQRRLWEDSIRGRRSRTRPRCFVTRTTGHPYKRAKTQANVCTDADDTGRGIISWEIFVFKESGKLVPWRNPGALAVQRVREAVSALGFAMAKNSPSELFPGGITPARNHTPPLYIQPHKIKPRIPFYAHVP